MVSCSPFFSTMKWLPLTRAIRQPYSRYRRNIPLPLRGTFAAPPNMPLISGQKVGKITGQAPQFWILEMGFHHPEF
jgi:hypothetical protein